MASNVNDDVTDSDFQGFVDKNDILGQLGLTDFFPERLSLEDIRRHDFDSNETSTTEIKWALLSKLIGLNSHARDVELHAFLQKKHDFGKHGQIMPTNEVDSFNSFFSSVLSTFSTESPSPFNINPLDVFYAVFCCCNPFLKQLLISKMFMCRLAVPFISAEWMFFGSPLMWIWPLRSIMIEGKASDFSTIQKGLVKSELKIVSSIRLGRPSISKSNLLNRIMSDQYLDTFYNRDCPLGTTQRSISDGLIEASWVLPSRDIKENFSDVTMFLNLRGDGQNFKTQCDMLKTISHLILLVLDAEIIEQKSVISLSESFLSAGKFVVYAVDSNDTSIDKISSKLQTFLAHMKPHIESIRFLNINKQKGFAAIKDDVQNGIKDFLKKSTFKTIESLPNCLNEFKLKADEHSQTCTKGLTKSKAVLDLVDNCRKKEVLPLQNPAWIEWTQIDKKQRKATEALELENTDKLERQKVQIRKRQHAKCGKLHKAIRKLISILIDLEIDGDELRFFILSLKQGLDEMSKVNMPDMIKKYQEKWKKWESYKGKKIDAKRLNAYKMEVDEAERNLVETPFGYEHLIREIGQIYECVNDIGPVPDKIITSQIKQCPKLVARQLLLGQPFEIMDGDAANIPITWVNAVLGELQSLIGNVTVLSISVLGIQSSGKSTLLNTMFGLQFAVSAGRCTRGVYVQLVEVPKGKYDFEYILVIDTEGLRAPELSDVKHEHDNELATLVLGLGDITIINVKGENTNDVSDVLQIATHAFLRLKQTTKNSISLYQSCLFVHQNVPAKDAKEQMIHGRKKFVETLDKMTKQAAEQENMSHISSFQQVMDFDSEDHVFYFPDLWCGDPPMAPINVGYSKHVDHLKAFLMTEIVDKRSTYLTLSDTRRRIIDLWEGIQTDDFVFSFRNSTEVKAYNQLESYFQSLAWEVEGFAYKFVIGKLESSFRKCSNIQEVKSTSADLKKEFQNSMQEKLALLLENWKKWVNENPYKEIVIQWKETKANRLKRLSEDHRMQVEIEIESVHQKAELEVKYKTGLSKEEECLIFDKARKIAEKLKGEKPSDANIIAEFSKLWKSIKKDIGKKFCSDDISIGEQIEHALHEFMQNDAIYLKSLRDKKEAMDVFPQRFKDSVNLKDITPEHIGVHSSEDTRYSMREDHAILVAMKITSDILNKVESTIVETRQKKTKFNIVMVKNLFKIIEAEIKTFNEHKTNTTPFNLLKPYQAMLLDHTAKYAEMVFTEMNEEYEQMSGWQKNLKRYEKTLWEVFKARVAVQSEEMGAVEEFVSVVEDMIKELVKNEIPLDVQNIILADFAHIKFHLMTRVMDSLAEEDNFEQFDSYIKNPEEATKRWLIRYTEKKIFQKSRDEKINMYEVFAREKVSKVLRLLEKALKASIQKNPVDVAQWAKCFIAEIKNEVPLLETDLGLVIAREIPDVRRFSETLIKVLGDRKEHIFGEYKDVSDQTVKWGRINPIDNAFRRLWGCRQNCPFCGEPCQKADPEHCSTENNDYHMCIQHRPVGIYGMHKVHDKTLVIEVCNYKVQSAATFRCSVSKHECRKSGVCKSNDDTTFHPYRDYKTFFPAWDIAPSTSMHSSDFWSWYLSSHVDDICKKYNLKKPKIPESWMSITKSKARESLRKSIE